MTDRAEFAQALRGLIGLRCWLVIGGRGTGSHFTADFGKRVAHKVPLSNRTLSATARQYRGAYGLFVQGPWRLSMQRRRLFIWTDALEADAMMSALNQLRHASVTAIRLRLPNATLSLSNGLTLTIFGDEPEYASEPLFALWTPVAGYTVYNSGSIERH